MDYDFANLGEKQFEHLTQALLVRFVGPRVVVYGAGADGGREATWTLEDTSETAGSPTTLPQGWSKLCVAQAKYRNNPEKPDANAKWLIATISDEFDEWTKEKTLRDQKPDGYLIVTNVRLSAIPRKGQDKVRLQLLALATEKGMPLDDLVIWHYDQLRTLLDNAADVRAAYTAWITPGDVLKRLIDSSVPIEQNLQEVLVAHAAKSLIEEERLNLAQAGSVGDSSINLSDVFIDLPAYPAEGHEAETKTVRQSGRAVLSGIAQEVIATSNRMFRSATLREDLAASRACRPVLIGGPGQGKSTLTRYLAQLYRASFIDGSPVLDAPEVRQVADSVRANAIHTGIPIPSARRWPMRITLTAFADSLANQEVSSVIGYIAQQVNKKSGCSISDENLRYWLKNYPWFVIFDGLDEVPDSSNREQILQEISNFFIDARNVDADVIILATTRPQGYNDDFGRTSCRHYELAPLSSEIALAYGETLLNKRLGVDTERAAVVVERLKRALRDPHVSILTSTPLQTTILAILLERLGQAPRDRYRLFASYFRVIYQREQEKGGELAELLTDYEGDIHAVHFQLGLMLQRGGESSGDAHSTITKPQLEAVIAERMRAAGNSDADAERLAAKIVKLTTERLVFLAVLRSDSIGFELRSLQEYMAAEKIISGPEQAISDNLRAIAESSYWRNVTLFAIGSIVVNREHLGGSIIALCSELNIATSAHRVTLTGSRLALSILQERITATKPTLSRTLAKISLELLKLPPNENIGPFDVDTLIELGQHDILEVELREACQGTASQQHSAALALGRIVNYDTHEIWAEPLLAQLEDTLDRSSCLTVLRIALSHELPKIVNRFSDVLSQLGPVEAFSQITQHSVVFSSDAANQMIPDHWKALTSEAFFDRGASYSVEGLPSLRAYGFFERHITDAFEHLRSYSGAHPEWKAIAQIAEYCATWNVESFLNVLQSNTDVISALAPLSYHFPFPFGVLVSELFGPPQGLVDDRYVLGGVVSTDCISRYRHDRIADFQLAHSKGLIEDLPKVDNQARCLQFEEFVDWTPEKGSVTGIPLPIGPDVPMAVSCLFGGFSYTHNYRSTGAKDEEMLSEREWWILAIDTLNRMPVSYWRSRFADLLNFVIRVARTDESELVHDPDRWNRILLPRDKILKLVDTMASFTAYQPEEWLRIVDEDDPNNLSESIVTWLGSTIEIGSTSPNTIYEADQFIRGYENAFSWQRARVAVACNRDRDQSPILKRVQSLSTKSDIPLIERKLYAMADTMIIDELDTSALLAWANEILPFLLEKTPYHGQFVYEVNDTIDVHSILSALMVKETPVYAAAGIVIAELLKLAPDEGGRAINNLKAAIASVPAQPLSFESIKGFDALA